MSFYLPRKSRALWQIRLSVLALLVIAILISLSVFSKWMLLPAAVVFITALSAIFVALPAHFKSYVITADKSCITIHRGFIFKSNYIIPNRLVLIKTFRTPLAKRLGLAVVAVKAIKWWLVLPEMQENDVKRLLGSKSK